MRPLIDGTLLVLLALTGLSYVTAEHTGPTFVWMLLGIAAVKALLIQAVFMELTRNWALLLAVSTGFVGFGVGIGWLLTH